MLRRMVKRTMRMPFDPLEDQSGDALAEMNQPTPLMEGQINQPAPVPPEIDMGSLFQSRKFMPEPTPEDVGVQPEPQYEDDAMRLYLRHLQDMPQREDTKPSIGRRILSALGAGMTGIASRNPAAGVQYAEDFNNTRYNEAARDWATRGVGLKAGAEIESDRLQQRQLDAYRRAMIGERANSREARVGESKADREARIAEGEANRKSREGIAGANRSVTVDQFGKAEAGRTARNAASIAAANARAAQADKTRKEAIAVQRESLEARKAERAAKEANLTASELSQALHQAGLSDPMIGKYYNMAKDGWFYTDEYYKDLANGEDSAIRFNQFMNRLTRQGKKEAAPLPTSGDESPDDFASDDDDFEEDDI